VVLSDHPISADESIAQTQENYWGINATQQIIPLLLLSSCFQVPLVVLSDHPISADESITQTQENYWGINVTHVEAALAHLLSEGQEGVIITTWHELHKHKQLAAALHKATRSHSESVVDVPTARDYKGTDMGMHTHSHTFIDPDVLMKEIELSADMLTHGLVSECPGCYDVGVYGAACGVVL
jgi:hypothetical protein